MIYLLNLTLEILEMGFIYFKMTGLIFQHHSLLHGGNRSHLAKTKPSSFAHFSHFSWRQELDTWQGDTGLNRAHDSTLVKWKNIWLIKHLNPPKGKEWRKKLYFFHQGFKSTSTGKEPKWHFNYLYISLNYFSIKQVMKSCWVSDCLCFPRQLSLILKKNFYFLLFLIWNPKSLLLSARSGPCPLSLWGQC